MKLGERAVEFDNREARQIARAELLKLAEDASKEKVVYRFLTLVAGEGNRRTIRRVGLRPVQLAASPSLAPSSINLLPTLLIARRQTSAAPARR